MKIGTVVVWYNPDENVMNNISTYIEESDHLYIIDNSDKDNSYLIKNIDAQYVLLDRNRGIAYALNKGIEMAVKDSCDWILTMDQDSYFENNIIGIYKKFIKNNDCSNIGLLCPVYHTDRTTIKSDASYKYLKYVMQSANLVNIKAYKEIGRYDEKLFIDVVDFDYCFRMRKCRYKIVQCSEAVLNHKPATTRVKKIFGKEFKYGVASPLRYYYQVRNIKYVVHEYKSFKMYLILLYKIFKCHVLFDNKADYIIAIKKAKYDYKNGIYGKKEL